MISNLRLYQSSSNLRILQMRSVHRSWDCENGAHCGGIRRRDCESGYEKSRSVEFFEDYAIVDEVNEIDPSASSQKGVVVK